VLTLDVPPERILSLVPSATGILLALGQQEKLVGRTDYDMAPEVANLPSVGGGLGASVERIVMLDPDLVIHFRADSDPGTPRQLEAAGIAHLAIRPDRIEDVRRILRMIGSVVRESAQADSLVAALDAGLAEVSARVAQAPRPRVVLIGGDPPTVAGPGTFLHELVVIAGGENAFADVGELYAPVSLEEIIRRDVDLILAPETVRVPPALEGIPIRRIPLDVLTPGIEVTASARVLASLLHPEISW
jgi:iron complex transport system substrate-binding protein